MHQHPFTIILFWLAIVITSPIKSNAAILFDTIPTITVTDPQFSQDLVITTRLSGANEVPAVETNATGLATITFNEDMTQATLNATVSNLSSSFTKAHIHEAPAGENGSSIINLTEEHIKGRITKTFDIDRAFVAKLLTGQLYVNVHTENHGSGELRGQLGLEAPESFVGTFSGANEVPAVETAATGIASLHYTEGTNTIELNAQWDGLSSAITKAHFHVAPAGENGGSVFTLTDFIVGNTIKAKFPAGDYLTDLQNGNVYINIHTENHGSGAIRAQLSPTHGVIVDSWLTNDQEPHEVTVDQSGIGLAVFQINSTLDTIHTMVQLSQHNPVTKAHLHQGVLGEGGSSIVNYAEGINGSVITGTHAIDQALLTSILSGGIYINVHTEENPSGELRGQLYRLARDAYAFDLCSEQEIPTATGAENVAGSGLVAFNRDKDEMHLMVVVNELTSAFTGAHIHNAPAGEKGSNVFAFTDHFMNGGAFLYATPNSEAAFTDTIAQMIQMGNAYINIHTENNTSGELRGQIVKTLDCPMLPTPVEIPAISITDPQFSQDLVITTRLSGANEVPAVETNATGLATITFNEDMTQATLNATVSNLSSSFTKAHIHEAPAGENGSSIINLTEEHIKGRITKAFDIDKAFVAKLLTGQLYVNVHTENHGSGELRGQLALEAPESFVGTFSGANEVPAVETAATGIASLHYTEGTNTIELNAQWDGLSSAITKAHFHVAPAGENGGSVFTLTDFIVGNTIKAKFPAGDYLTDLQNGNVYINIHTENHGSGAIRAQLTPTHGVIVDSWLTNDQEPHEVTVDQNGIGLAVFQINSTLDTIHTMVQLSQHNPVTKAHLHQGVLGEGGSSIINYAEGINGSVITGTHAIDQALLTSILSGGIYINVHTEENPSGELRGQLYRLARDAYAFDLCSEQEVPAATGAENVAGSGLVAFNRDKDEMHLMVVVNELTSAFTGAHIHNAPVGEKGSNVFAFTDHFMNGGAFLYATPNSEAAFTDTIAQMIQMGNAYINIHTENNTSGELRGQIVKTLDCPILPIPVEIPAISITDPQFSQDLVITTRLSGANEVPAVETNATGLATITFNEDMTQATLNATVSNLSSSFTKAHIHEAPAGENGSSIINLTEEHIKGRITKAFDIDKAFVAKLLTGQLYVNVHTENHGSGELRGQLALEAPESFVGTFSGANEVPAVETAATGIASLHYTEGTNTIELNAQWDGLSSAITKAHFHVAPAGENGGSVFTLTDFIVGNTIKAKFPAGDYLTDLQNGNVYINIHTENHGSGAIRAQLTPTHGVIVDSWLTNDQEPHEVTVDQNGIGLAVFQINSTLDTIHTMVQLSQHNPVTKAHLHQGVLGEGGSSIINYAEGINGSVITGTHAIDQALLTSILSGGIYINVHTEENPSGELRGQLYRLARDAYAFDLCSEQEVPAATGAENVAGSGLVAFNRDKDEMHLMVVVNELTSAFTGAHIHNAPVGEKGSNVFAFTDHFMNGGAFLYATPNSEAAFTDTIAQMIQMGNAYINIHTENNTSGELRGQIVKTLDCPILPIPVEIPAISITDPQFSQDLVITTRLSGANEVPAVETNATGLATITFNEDMTQATLNATVSNLSSAFTKAHIHEAPAGENGSSIINLTEEHIKSRMTKTFDIDKAFVAKLLTGQLYVNVHTENNGSGELRGQLALEAPESFVGTFSGANEVPAVETAATGIASLHYTEGTNTIELNAQWDGLSSAITKAHFHIAPAGENGGSVFTLTDFIVGNTIKAKFPAGDYLADLQNGNVYINIHTENHGSGAIRAQLSPMHGVIVDSWLTNDQEPHEVTVDQSGIGLAVFQINSTLDTIHTMVQLSQHNPVTKAHLHQGVLGEGGSSIINYAEGINGSVITGTHAIDQALLTSILSGGIYINVHTEENPSGELRGQLYRLARDAYAFDLCSEQEIPAATGAENVAGSGLVAFNRDKDEMHLMVVVNELTSAFTGAHIHNAPAGEKGSNVFAFTDHFMNGGAFLYATPNSEAAFTDTIAQMIQMGNAYINIHTENNTSGELRGQIIKTLDCPMLSTSIVEVGKETIRFEVYPNPANEVLILNIPQISNNTLSKLELKVFDSLGRTLIQLDDFKKNQPIDISKLSAGFYYLSVSSGNSIGSIKFTKR